MQWWWQWFEWFICCCVIYVLVANFLIANKAKARDSGEIWLHCDVLNPKYEWVSVGFWGFIFDMCHIACIISSAVQAERTFYSTPHHMGYFD